MFISFWYAPKDLENALYLQWVFASIWYVFFVQTSCPFLQVFAKVWILVPLMIPKYIQSNMRCGGGFIRWLSNTKSTSKSLLVVDSWWESGFFWSQSETFTWKSLLLVFWLCHYWCLNVFLNCCNESATSTQPMVTSGDVEHLGNTFGSFLSQLEML